VWVEDTRSATTLHRGDEITAYESLPGNYARFYTEVRHAIAGEGDWPVSTADAIAVAKIIDQARKISIR
jgi:hypothetical protein